MSKVAKILLKKKFPKVIETSSVADIPKNKYDHVLVYLDELAQDCDYLSDFIYYFRNRLKIPIYLVMSQYNRNIDYAMSAANGFYYVLNNDMSYKDLFDLGLLFGNINHIGYTMMDGKKVEILYPKELKGFVDLIKDKAYRIEFTQIKDEDNDDGFDSFYIKHMKEEEIRNRRRYL